MCPLARAKTDSVWARASRFSAASRTDQGSTSNTGCVMRVPRLRRLPAGVAGLCRRLAPLAAPDSPGPYSNTVPSGRAPRAAPDGRAWAAWLSQSVVSWAPEQVGEVGDDDVGAVLEQRVAPAGAVHTDDEAESPCSPRLDPGERVLEHGRFCGPQVEGVGRGEERVGLRLASQVFLLRHDAVDDDLEQLLDA